MTGKVVRYLRLCRAIYADPRTPRRSRWLLWAALAYLASPIDLIPDCIPVLGHLDDAVIVPALVALALWLVPWDVYREHRDRLRDEPPDGA